MGNRRSVQKALEHVGATVAVTHDHDKIKAADGLVLPGVGAFPLAMRNLDDLGLAEVIRARVAAAVPLLGICLGMQLLFERSEELRDTDGLGLLRGDVRWVDSRGQRIPHIGWNEVRFERASPLTTGLPQDGCPFYHVHSLAAHPTDPDDIVGTCEYGERFATVVAHGSVIGVQFHPEKSSIRGLQMLENFIDVCAARAGSANPPPAAMRA
jgi:glutamine amidotransferase